MTKDHIHWVKDWRSARFTHITRHARFLDIQRIKGWTLRRTHLNRCFVPRVFPYRRGSIMVWGGISFIHLRVKHKCRTVLIATILYQIFKLLSTQTLIFWTIMPGLTQLELYIVQYTLTAFASSAASVVSRFKLH